MLAGSSCSQSSSALCMAGATSNARIPIPPGEEAEAGPEDAKAEEAEKEAEGEAPGRELEVAGPVLPYLSLNRMPPLDVGRVRTLG